VVFLFSGIVLGAIYAISGASLTLRYATSGVLNLAFGAEAYFIARLFYFMNTQHGMSTWLSALISILVASPLMGIILYAAVYSRLQLTPSSVKLTATIGVSIALPALAAMLFGSPVILTAPGVVSSVETIRLFGAPVTYAQIAVVVVAVVIAVVGAVVLRLSSVGLVMRATVESPALASMGGANPPRVALAVCTGTTALAGLTGVLLAPIVGIGSSSAFLILLASSLGAVAAARLRFIGRAGVAGLLIGIAGGVAQRFLPSGSIWSSGVIASIPFIVMGGAVIYYAARGTAEESIQTGGALDRAIAVGVGGGDQSATNDVPQLLANRRRVGGPLRSMSFKDRGSVVIIALLALIPLFLSGVWSGVYCTGIAFAVVLLSYSFITGEGGMISLCQITFAGIGALTAAQLATTYHWPVVIAVLCGGVLALPFGLLVGFLGGILGDMYFALVTLAFGLFMENVVFSVNSLSNYGSGVVIARPGFATGNVALTYCILVLFLIFGAVFINLRRSTLGFGSATTRSSARAAQAVGMNPRTIRVVLSGLAALVAGIGGSLLALTENNANPLSFQTLSGLVWLAVIVTLGTRSLAAAFIGGVTFAVVPFVFSTYLPVSYAQVPIALFGLGAIMVARNPKGMVSLHAAQLEALSSRIWARRPQRSNVVPANNESSPDQVSTGERVGTR
jgi:branched-chain amino acid transport system permease protein